MKYKAIHLKELTPAFPLKKLTDWDQEKITEKLYHGYESVLRVNGIRIRAVPAFGVEAQRLVVLLAARYIFTEAGLGTLIPYQAFRRSLLEVLSGLCSSSDEEKRQIHLYMQPVISRCLRELTAVPHSGVCLVRDKHRVNPEYLLGTAWEPRITFPSLQAMQNAGALDSLARYREMVAEQGSLPDNTARPEVEQPELPFPAEPEETGAKSSAHPKMEPFQAAVLQRLDQGVRQLTRVAAAYERMAGLYSHWHGLESDDRTAQPQAAKDREYVCAENRTESTADSGGKSYGMTAPAPPAGDPEKKSSRRKQCRPYKSHKMSAEERAAFVDTLLERLAVIYNITESAKLPAVLPRGSADVLRAAGRQSPEVSKAYLGNVLMIIRSGDRQAYRELRTGKSPTRIHKRHLPVGMKEMKNA